MKCIRQKLLGRIIAPPWTRTDTAFLSVVLACVALAGCTPVMAQAQSRRALRVEPGALAGLEDELNAVFVSDGQPRPELPLEALGALRVIPVDVSGQSAPVYVASHTDTTGRKPRAEVGDTLLVYLTEAFGPGQTIVPVVVRERMRVAKGPGFGCAGFLPRRGWAFRIEPLAGAKLNEKVYTAVAALPFVARIDYTRRRAPPAALAAVRADYMSELDAVVDRLGKEYRGRVMGSGHGALEYSSGDFIRFRAPGGAVAYAISLSLRDDLSQHGSDSHITYLVTENGEILEKIRGEYNLIGSADVDGNGVDGLITRSGLLHWHRGRWVRPTAGEKVTAC